MCLSCQACYSTAHRSIAQRSIAQPSIAQRSIAEHGMLWVQLKVLLMYAAEEQQHTHHRLIASHATQ